MLLRVRCANKYSENKFESKGKFLGGVVCLTEECNRIFVFTYGFVEKFIQTRNFQQATLFWVGGGGGGCVCDVGGKS